MEGEGGDPLSVNKNPRICKDSQQSSPVCHTEGHLSAEQKEAADVAHLKVRKSGTLQARLALLAENIRQWENDVRHPTAACLHELQLNLQQVFNGIVEEHLDRHEDLHPVGCYAVLLTGPSAVRSPSFQMSGYVVFSLRELRCSQFTLNEVAYSSPLEGNIQFQLRSELLLDVRERGFLTVFEDLSGFGAWHRRWCLLEDANLSYWEYPENEKNKEPIGQIDLNMCTTDTVGLVSRDICARPHTFLLETTQPSQPEDENCLVLVRHGAHTKIRHLISADTREEHLLWCRQLNKVLAVLRAGGRKGSNP